MYIFVTNNAWNVRCRFRFWTTSIIQAHCIIIACILRLSYNMTTCIKLCDMITHTCLTSTAQLPLTLSHRWVITPHRDNTIFNPRPNLYQYCIKRNECLVCQYFRYIFFCRERIIEWQIFQSWYPFRSKALARKLITLAMIAANPGMKSLDVIECHPRSRREWWHIEVTFDLLVISYMGTKGSNGYLRLTSKKTKPLGTGPLCG